MDLENAITIALNAHKGQIDKGGNPYILHPLRVMLSLTGEDERVVGVLHDVVEDCAPKDYDWTRVSILNNTTSSISATVEPFTWEYLIQKGLTNKQLEALVSVSKTPSEEKEYKQISEEEKHKHYLEFIKQAKSNEIGRRVKEADIKDNLDTSRISKISTQDRRRLERYKVALSYLSS